MQKQLLFFVIENILNENEINKILEIISKVNKDNYPNSKSSNGEIYRLEYFMKNIPELIFYNITKFIIL